MSSENFVTVEGRIVQGHPLVGRDKDSQGNPLLYKNGPKAGQPRVEFYFGVAIEKAQAQPMIDAMKAKAAADFPAGEHNSPDFSWKYIDGDSIDKKGQPYSAREGFAGCYVFRFNGGYSPRVYITDAAGQYVEVIDPKGIKRGDYVRVSGNYRGNGQTQQPGLYLNHDMVLKTRDGEEIISGPSAADVFGASAPTATATPTPAPAAQPTQAPPPAATGFAAGAAGAATPPPPTATPAPPPAAPPAAPVFTMTAKAGGNTKEAMIAAGWTEEQLIEHGYAEMK